MSELVLELFSEEIPARMQKSAAEYLRAALEEKLKASGLSGSVQTFSTPRRIAAVAEGLPLKKKGSKTEKRGPRLDAPEQALQGFLKSSGLKKEDLQISRTDKGDFYSAVIEEKEKNTAEVLPGILVEICKEFPWPKSMRWGSREGTWVRPLKNMLCIFDGKVLPFKFLHLESNNLTYGHRFLSIEKQIKVSSFKEYKEKLKDNSVILDAAERRAEIIKSIGAKLNTLNLAIKKDEKLLDEVEGLVEWPEVLIGNIDKQFMDLPPEVLATSMRTHQKYFSAVDSKGAFAANFITVANIKPTDGGKEIIAGNERVLRARLSDAKFFWEQDKKKIENGEWKGEQEASQSRQPAASGRASSENLGKFSGEQFNKLSKMTFHARVGTIAEKQTRIAAIAEFVAPFLKVDAKNAKRAGEICKLDLVSEMVGEFAELQGIMGGYYAKLAGENQDVADAVREHYYYPVTYNNNGAETKKPLSLAIALADKIDSLVSLWAVGERATGSKDPYGLRRYALSIINIILDNNIRIELTELFKEVLSILPENLQDEKIIPELSLFFAERLKVILKEKGVRHDYIDAVLGSDDDLHRIATKADALKEFLSGDDGKNLLTAYKRAANIVAAEEKKDKANYVGKPEEKLLELAEEKQLYKALAEMPPKIEKLIAAEDFHSAMQELSNLRKPVDSFFDKVTVNSEKPEVRKNRLFLLGSLKALMDRIAMFSKIEG